MECLTLLVLAALAPIGWWLYRVAVRLRTVERRLARLQDESAVLRRTLAKLEREGVPAPPADVAADDAAPPGSVRSGEAESTREREPPPRPVPEVVELPEAAGPVAAPAPPGTAVPPPPEPRRGIDWERWIGVRGAAVVGAAILGLAGLLFVKYWIEAGLISPPVRVAAGVLAGLGSLAASEALRRSRHGYGATADALAGAGVVLLYGAVWAARALYALIGSGLAFALMALVTVACGALSWRRGSRVTAVLGLVGGFATPGLLSTGQDHPIGLFGYLLLLNLGVLVLALRRGWSFLAALSLGMTTFYQGFWILERMGPERTLLGLAVLAIFAVLYAAAGHRAGAVPDERRDAWRLTRVSGVLVPFAFTFFFAGNADFGPRLYPLAAFLLLLVLLARWIARQHGLPGVGIAGAAASLAAVAVWCVRTSFDTALAWEAVLSGVALALGVHLFWELDRRGGAAEAGRGLDAEDLAASGFLLLFVSVPLALHEPSPWPWLTGWTALSALLWRRSAAPRGRYLPVLASVAVGLGAGAFHLAHGGDRPAPVLLFILAAGIACQAAARWRRDPEVRRWAEGAAATLPLAFLYVLVVEAARPSLAPWSFYATTLGCAALTVLAATRMPSGKLVFAAMTVLAFDHWLWSLALAGEDGSAALLGLAAQGVAVVAFTFWPFLAGAAFRDRPWAWYAAALAGPAWFFPLRRLFVTSFGDGAIGLLPLALAVLSLAAFARCRRHWTPGDASGRSRLVWFAAVCLAFVSVAIPLQLEREWITVGWALEGLAVIALWRRLDHPGLKYFGLLLLAGASARLVLNPAVPGYYPASGWPVVNWLLYTYLVPAAALALSARLLAPAEVGRRRPWEEGLYARRWPLTAAACGLAAVVVVFAWINLTILDYFSTGRQLEISFDRLPARDLAMSLAWAVYALLLLGLGMAKAIRPLRWISLVFLMLTLVKVFLYDLGELKDLYRVASLVGLALSLLGVSLAYQRFVFGAPSAKDP